MVAALAAAKELPQLSLEDALELTLLVARKEKCQGHYPSGLGSVEMWAGA